MAGEVKIKEGDKVIIDGKEYEIDKEAAAVLEYALFDMSNPWRQDMVILKSSAGEDWPFLKVDKILKALGLID